MTSRRALSVAVVGLMSLWPLQTRGVAQADEANRTDPSRYARGHDDRGQSSSARSNEGYLIIGCQGLDFSRWAESWMLLEVGMTMLDDTFS